MANEHKDEMTGRFTKGNAGNKTGRAGKAAKEKERIQAVLNEIYREAGGDPVKGMRLQLERAADLSMSQLMYNKLCDKLAPYIAPKKSSVEGTVEHVAKYEIHYGEGPKVIDVIDSGGENETN